jgi:hypothetical protein
VWLACGRAGRTSSVVRQEFCIQLHEGVVIHRKINIFYGATCVFLSRDFSIQNNCSENNFFPTQRKSKRTPMKMASQISSTGQYWRILKMPSAALD